MGSRRVERLDGVIVVVLHHTPVWLEGTETWIYGQLRALPPEVESHVVCEEQRNLDQFPWPAIHSRSAYQRVFQGAARRLGLGFLAERSRGKGLVAAARRLNASILHSHFGDVGWRDMAFAREAGVRHVVTFYGHEVGRLPTVDSVWRERYAELFSTADRILCEGPRMRETLIELGCPKEKVRVQPLGVDLDGIPFVPRGWMNGTPLRVLIAASFREKKGIPSGIQALARLQSRTLLEVTIAGDASAETRSLDEKARILAAVRASGLESRVRFTGALPHAELMSEAYRHHIFLAPSRTASDGDSEGGAPVTIIEMAATGMPVVSTEHCDIPEIIQHGSTGLLAAEGDIGGLADRLAWLAENPAEWPRLTEAARAHIQHRFNALVQGRKLAEAYLELSASSGLVNT